MSTDCSIHFVDNPAKVFYAGQLLSGRVELTFTDSKTVRGIYVEISGTAYCHWTEGSGDNKKSYTGNESYLAERSYFVGGRGAEDTNVPAGQYQYNFHCNLPAGLPTSLEGDVGYIRYRVRVVLDIPLWPDEEFEDIFTVIKPLNLNYDSTLRLPAFNEKYKTFFPFCFCFCCPSDPLHLIARIPVSGYTPGQTINVEIDVDNKSETDADVSVQLIKSITYYIYANSAKQRSETIVVCEKQSIGESRLNTFESFRIAMVIPPIPPSDETTSNICKVRYVLRVIGVVSGCHTDPLVDMPITIGSYPILDNLNLTSYPTEANMSTTTTEGGYSFPVSFPSLPTPPVMQQPTPNPTMHVPTDQPRDGFSEPDHPLLPSQNGTATSPPGPSSSIPLYPVRIPSSVLPSTGSDAPPTPAPPYPGVSPWNASMPSARPPQWVPSYRPSAPYPDDDPPTYEQATKGNEVAGKSFRPNYPVYRRATSYSSASNEND